MENLNIFDVFGQYFTAFKNNFSTQIASPAWDNPYYIIPAICLLTFILELALPKKQKYSVTTRKGFWLDLFYVIFIDYLLLLFGFFALASTVEYLFRGGLEAIGIASPVLFDLKATPFIIQFVVVFLLMDFMQWFGHFLLHRVDFLWNFHKVHHAQEELGFASTRHFHWMEYIVFKPLLFLPFLFLNFSAAEFIVIYLWIGWFFTFFSHCNVKVNARWFNYIFISPETHYWHHAKAGPMRYGVNFASTLTIWDHIFGFFYYPKDEKEPELGVEDQEKMPTTFLGQFIMPFVHAFSFGKRSKREQPMTRAEKRRRAKLKSSK